MPKLRGIEYGSFLDNNFMITSLRIECRHAVKIQLGCVTAPLLGIFHVIGAE